jgi:hypothetical protein
MKLRKPLSQHQLSCYIIKKFVNSKNIPWGYEINQAKKLIQFEPNCNFWFNIKKKPIKSLEWLLSFEGKKYLLKEKSLLNVDKDIKISYHLETTKIGNDKTINKKVKTLKEFLNGKT